MASSRLQAVLLGLVLALGLGLAPTVAASIPETQGIADDLRSRLSEPRPELDVSEPESVAGDGASLPETRVRAFRLFDPLSRPGYNGVSRANATRSTLGLWGNRVGPVQKGLWTDPVTGNAYARARWYDARNGVFLTEDPMGDTDSPNLYAFVAWRPSMATDPLGLALYAFDGTWNDPNSKAIQEADARFTNVHELSELYKKKLFYQKGVGTSWWTKHAGGLTGAGSRRRVRKAYKRLVNNYREGDTTIDIIGFSRGAAAAREFAEQIHEIGIELEDGTVVYPEVRFLGLFDTVYSMGWPGNDTDPGYSNEIPPNVQNLRHAIASDERRYGFELTAACPRRGCPDNFVEQWFAGAHSDQGGGYLNNEASRIALNWMWSEAVQLGVPFAELRDELAPPKILTTVHDSMEDHEEISPGEMRRRTIERGPRTVYYPKEPE